MLNMLPSFSAKYAAYLHNLYSKFLPYFSEQSTLLSENEYLSNVVRSYLGILGSFSVYVSALLHRIGHVFFMSPKKQMLWVYTRRIIAFMQYRLTLWDRAIVKFPRKPMCEDVVVSVEPYKPVSMNGFTATPNPASIRFGNSGPKTGFYGCAFNATHDAILA